MHGPERRSGINSVARIQDSMSWTGLPLNLTQASTLTRGQLLDLMLDVEAGLRSFVIAILSKHNADWTTLIPGSIMSELQSACSSSHGEDLWKK